MFIIQLDNFSRFANAFLESRDDFSIEGLQVLFDDLWDWEEHIELDPVAICSDYSEFKDEAALLSDYSHYDTIEEIQEQTAFYRVTSSGSIIIRTF